MAFFPDRNAYPYSAVVFVSVTWSDGSTTRSSGALVGPNDVLTAAHAVTSPFATPTDIDIFPAYNGKVSAIYPSFTSGNWRVNSYDVDTDGNGFLLRYEAAQDFAVIGLSQAIGQSTGWFGLVSGADSDFYTVASYPITEGRYLTADEGYLWQSNVFDIRGVYHRAGSSGGPIFDPEFNVVGLVSTTNWGARIDNGEWDQLFAWAASNDDLLIVPPNTPPVATISDRSLDIREWSQVSEWISYSDADGNAATHYEFWDSGSAARSGYFWTPDNGRHAADTAIAVAASDIADVWVRGGRTSDSETMWVRAFDGTEWSEWDFFDLTTVGPNTPPVATISDHSLSTHEWSQVVDWVSYFDADTDAATDYQFWDSGAAADSGYFWTPDNAHHAAHAAIDVDASDLANVWVRGGQVAGAETLWVRAFDGTEWSTWDSFELTTII